MIMAVDALFDKKRKEEIRSAIRRGEPPVTKSQRAKIKEEGPMGDGHGPVQDSEDGRDAAAGAQHTSPQRAAPAVPHPAQNQTAFDKLRKMLEEEFEDELFGAVEANDEKRIAIAQAKGANIDGWDRDSRTYLIRAVEKMNWKVLDFLLSRKVAVNARDYLGQTALAYAAKNGWGYAAKTLISHGAEVDLPDLKKRTPLMHAVINRNREMVDLLIKRKADINARDADSTTALGHAKNLSPFDAEMYRLLMRNGAQE